MRREALPTPVSSTWVVHSVSAVSMIANRSAKNGAATAPNSIAVTPLWSRRNRPAAARAAAERVLASRGTEGIFASLRNIMLPIAEGRPARRREPPTALCMMSYGKKLSERLDRSSRKGRISTARRYGRRRPLALRRERIALRRLSADLSEVLRGVAEEERRLAARRAGIGLALEPALHRDDGLARRLDADQRLREQDAGAVERDEVRDPVALAGDDHDAVPLHRDVGDDRVADDDRLRALRKLHHPGMVDHHGERRLAVRRGGGGLAAHRAGERDQHQGSTSMEESQADAHGTDPKLSGEKL